METSKQEKKTPLKYDKTACMWWFNGRIHIEVYSQSAMETLFFYICT